MARARTPLPIKPAPQLTPAQMQRGIERLAERIKAVRTFDISSVRDRANPPEILALATGIQDTLEKTFGEGTSRTKRFEEAWHLAFRPMGFSANYPGVQHYQQAIRENLARSAALLAEAIKTLEEDLNETGPTESQPETPKQMTAPAPNNKIFVVHGHDEGAREALARFIERIGFEAVILHEQANQGRTIIEKFMAHGEVGFAIVLLTPDDEGCERGGTPRPRARQNVILELGYFVGRLGRDRVIALRKGDVELPSDFAGVVYEELDGRGAWRSRIGQELQAAGYSIDWNKVMQP